MEAPPPEVIVSAFGSAPVPLSAPANRGEVLPDGSVVVGHCTHSSPEGFATACVMQDTASAWAALRAHRAAQGRPLGFEGDDAFRAPPVKVNAWLGRDHLPGMRWLARGGAR